MFRNFKTNSFIVISADCACEPGRTRDHQAGPGAVKGESAGEFVRYSL
jgi:hypothetical protein